MQQTKILFCWCFFSLGLLMLSCKGYNDTSFTQPPDFLVLNFDPLLQKVEQIWLYKGQPFSGFMIEVENGKIVYKLPIIQGKESGLALGWYNSGDRLMERYFIRGKKGGIFKQWWPNGKLRYTFNFKNDLFEGKQLVFYPDGSLREVSNYVMGKPEGKQKSWDEQHKLISNYTIRNGKIFGIMAVKSCMPVSK